MYLGIDLGTSGVKIVLVDGSQNLVDQATAPLTVSRPQALWSEQDPADWWDATVAAMAELRGRRAAALAAVRGLGLSGQMHGATLLDQQDRVLRPAILWNDGRSGRQCRTLEEWEPASRTITGNLAMPGFTAPKLLWLAEAEPEVFAATAKVLLPKDYLRLRLTGEHVSEMSDAAGTLWLDVAARDWSDAMLDATLLDRAQMPRLVEGSAPSGTVRAEVAALLGIPPAAVVAGGAGDNAAGAAGVGVVAPGSAFLSLGTSGVLFVANGGFAPNPGRAVHAFCHCFPDIWHQMSVILSAAGALTWAASLIGAGSEAEAVAAAEAAEQRAGPGRDRLLFLPYLSGERTPHNDPAASGVFFGLDHGSDRGALVRAVLEGVAFAFADGLDALVDAGTEVREISLIGGGARSRYWAQILAAALDRPLRRHEGGEVGPAFGAARLAMLAADGGDPASLCTAPPILETVEPEPARTALYRDRIGRYRHLYRDLKPLMAATLDAQGL